MRSRCGLTNCRCRVSGVSCRGIIDGPGCYARGSAGQTSLQSLPGKYEARRFSVKSFVPKALVAIFVACMLPTYWIAFKAPAVGFYHDDGIYLVTAKALAEGRGYRIISLPGGPPQTKYPILFPAVLSVAWKIFPSFPENALFLKTIPLLSAIVWLWLSYRLIREETGSHDVALWIVLLTAASSEVVFFSTTFMSETFFACLATGALIWLKRLEGTGSGRGAAGPSSFPRDLYPHPSSPER